MVATGIDPGGSAALAVVRDGVLVSLADVSGVRWFAKMQNAILLAQGPIWCERPAKKIHKGSPMRNHNSAFGLGRNVGRWEAVAADYGHTLTMVETAEWWAGLPTRLTGKRGDGLHRVDECCGMVQRCAGALDAIPEGRRPDAAEAILIAFAASRCSP